MKGIVRIIGALTLPFTMIVFCALAGAGVFVRSTLTWPSRPHDPEGKPRLTGWYISSGYGWRASLSGNDIEFHDGIDLASSTGNCPFAERCEVVSMVDGVVTFIGWDDGDDPLGKGGGQMVSVMNGDGAIETIYAHLEPYRHYVRLEGRIDDPYGRYDEWRDYGPIGEGELTPGPESVKVKITCQNDAPEFLMTEGGATMTFVYDRPAKCTTSVEWSSRGDDWEGWIPDGATTARWETPISGPRDRRIAEDVGVLFRATLIPPPPPPTATPLATPGAFIPGDARSPRATPVAQLQELVQEAHIGVPCRPVERPCVWTWSMEAQVARERSIARDSRADGARGIGGPLTGSRIRGRHVGRSVVHDMESRTFVSVRVDGDINAPAGGRRVIYLVASSDSFPLTMGISHHPAITVRDMTILNGGCAGSGNQRVCERQSDSQTVIGRIIVDVDVNASAGDLASFTVSVTDARGSTVTAETSLVVLDERVTPQPWPPPAPTAAAPAPAYPPPSPGDPRPMPAPPGDRPGSSIACSAQPLVAVPWSRLPNNHHPRLLQPAAQQWELVRNEIIRRAGTDPFARIADALRAPEFRSSKPGVALYSWHMTGRAIDLDLGYPWQRVRDGRYWRLYVNGVDVTEVFERHGWNRIPDRSDSLEWWHYELRDGLSWRQAMRQAWALERLKTAFPEIPWESIGCAGVDGVADAPPIMDMTERCASDMPDFNGLISTAPGCGPPVRLGEVVRMLTDRVGFVGRTGTTTGWHLHISVRVSGVNGASSTYVCSDAWLKGRSPPPDAICWTDTADPLDFLPLAVDGNGVVDGQPMQLAPPDLSSEYALGDRRPSGMYWSPNPIDGPYGGGLWRQLQDWRRGERNS